MATLTSKITLSSPNITSDSLNISTSNNLTKSNGGDHYMTLLAGECAFFPWETSVDLYADVASGTPTLEYMIFEV